MGITKKTALLQKNLSHLSSLVIAYSGGLDSTLLLAVASKLANLQPCIAVTGVSKSIPEGDLQRAKRFCKEEGIRHILVSTNEVSLEEYVKNPENRCFFCKTELYEQVRKIAEKEGVHTIADGTNCSDLSDYRPGLKAAEEAGVIHPLVEAGFAKKDVRVALKELGYACWDMPSSPCLSSRIPYGEMITPQKLKQVEDAETYMHSLGFSTLRVRHHGDIARIEIPKEDFSLLLSEEISLQIQKKLHTIGFRFITLDIEGFRSGAFNPFVTEKESKK